MKKFLIDLKDVSYSVQNSHILRNINLSISEGEKIAVLGQSGAGKTTLISIINGTLKQTNGTYKIFNRNYITLKREERMKIGTIWQDLRLIEDLSAEQNVNCGLLSRKNFIFAIKNLSNLCSFKEAHTRSGCIRQTKTISKFFGIFECDAKRVICPPKNKQNRGLCST